MIGMIVLCKDRRLFHVFVLYLRLRLDLNSVLDVKAFGQRKFESSLSSAYCQREFLVPGMLSGLTTC